MYVMPMEKDHEQHLERFFRLLPETPDITLVLLKGHLLLEEQLSHIIEECSRRPQALEGAKITFAQKIRLAEALTGQHIELMGWLRQLNQIRNALAHNVEVPDLPERFDRLFGRMARVPSARNEPDLAPPERLRRQIVFAAGCLHALAIWFRVPAKADVQANKWGCRSVAGACLAGTFPVPMSG